MGFNSQIRPLATPEWLFTENRLPSGDFRNMFAFRNGLINEYSFYLELPFIDSACH